MSGPASSALSVTVNRRARRRAGRVHAARAARNAIGSAGGGVAVAINREVVPRSEYARRQLCDGDRVEILEAVGGG